MGFRRRDVMGSAELASQARGLEHTVALAVQQRLGRESDTLIQADLLPRHRCDWSRPRAARRARRARTRQTSERLALPLLPVDALPYRALGEG